MCSKSERDGIYDLIGEKIPDGYPGVRRRLLFNCFAENHSTLDDGVKDIILKLTTCEIYHCEFILSENIYLDTNIIMQGKYIIKKT